MSTSARLRSFSLVTALLLAGLTACNKSQTQSAQNQIPATQTADVPNGNPADGNLAPAGQYTSEYASQPAETPPVASSAQSYAPPTGDYPSDYDQTSYEQPVQASEPPPPLPDYTQPPAPGDDYVWTPGYWNYSDAGYYWVPGVWVLAPWVGALWTPPWWGYDNGAYLWHSGYWGPNIGYYGGIDYGYGYTGRGYYGAYWNHGQLDYNRAVTNVDPARIHNVYNQAVPSERHDRVSYNGGRAGINARPTAQELAVTREPRTPPVRTQVEHARQAASDRAQFAKTSGGRPGALVATRPLATTYKAPASRPPEAAIRNAAPAHAQPSERPGTVATRIPENRTAPQQLQRTAPDPSRPETRPTAPERGVTAQRPIPDRHPEARPAPVERPSVPEAGRGPAQAAIRPQPAPRPAPVARPEARPAPRPAPAARPEARPALRPVPQARPEARPAARPAPQARPESRPAAPPHPAEHPKDERK